MSIVGATRISTNNDKSNNLDSFLLSALSESVHTYNISTSLSSTNDLPKYLT